MLKKVMEQFKFLYLLMMYYMILLKEKIRIEKIKKEIEEEKLDIK